MYGSQPQQQTQQQVQEQPVRKRKVDWMQQSQSNFTENAADNLKANSNLSLEKRRKSHGKYT
jgi:hypothetical protein